MKVLIVGGGGREHALAWRAAQGASVSQVFCAPGNAGTALEPNVENIAIGADDINSLLAFAENDAIDLTIVGPEAPLVAGIVDRFRAAGLACFGPSAAAAQLEGSKAFTKAFLARHDIPTADYQAFTDIDPAIAYLGQIGLPCVIKADGLAAGKGVVICQDRQTAEQAIQDMLSGQAFGTAGAEIVIEEFLLGEEASFICVVGGGQILPLASSQDHKARDAGDQGPNTGGMGAYSPAPVLTDAISDHVMHDIIEPTVAGLAAEGTPYTGFLYAGLMIDADGKAKVLEYNCRFGDPETQPIMLRLQSDLAALCVAALGGDLNRFKLEWSPKPALGVVMAAGGYPGSYSQGDVISGLNQMPENVKVFHAGTRLEDGQVKTAGGRVLCVTALGDNVTEAQAKAYAGVEAIHWEGAFSRPDIGYRAVAREQP